jgi:hypothetical protein
MTIYPKPGHKLLYTPMTGEMKCPTNILLPCTFHSISFNVDITHAPTNHKWYDPLYIIMWPYLFIDLDFTWFSPLLQSIAPSHHSTCPSHLQPVHQAKSCLDLLHLSHMTQCHVSYAMSSFITCVSFATYPKTISPPWIVLLTHMYMWSNHLCISHKHILVHLGCDSITKTK